MPADTVAQESYNNKVETTERRGNHNIRDKLLQGAWNWFIVVIVSHMAQTVSPPPNAQKSVITRLGRFNLYRHTNKFPSNQKQSITQNLTFIFF